MSCGADATGNAAVVPVAAAWSSMRMRPAGHPLGFLVNLAESCLVDVRAPEFDDGIGLPARQAQVVPPEHLHGLIRPQAHHAGRRFRAADDDDAAVGRKLADGVENRRVKCRLRRYLLVVVENQGKWQFERRVEVLKVVAGKSAQVAAGTRMCTRAVIHRFARRARVTARPMK